METERIDELLTRYEAAERRISANLIELEDHPTYVLLSKGTGGTSTLSGITAQRAEPVMASAPLLWDWFHKYGIGVAEARSVRNDGRMNGERRTRLAEMLSGDSIVLSQAEIPMSERGLLETGEQVEMVSLEDLLTKMREAYEPIRDLVAEVDALWRDVLPRTEAATITLGRLEASVAELNVVEPSITRARRKLDHISSLLVDDPLQLTADSGAELDDLVNEAATTLAELRRGFDQLDGDLAATERQLAEVRVLRARAEKAYEEATTKITNVTDVVRVPSADAIDGPNGLAARADALRADATGSWQARRAALDTWSTRCEALRNQLQRAEDANEVPLRRRSELRGLLAAYWVKAAAVGGAEDAALTELHDQAHNELFTAPTDLAAAEGLVAAFGAAMRRSTTP